MDQFKSIQKKDSSFESKYIGNIRFVPKPTLNENDIPQAKLNDIPMLQNSNVIDNDLPY